MNKHSTIEDTGKKRCLIRLNLCKLPHSPHTPHNEVDATKHFLKMLMQVCNFRLSLERNHPALFWSQTTMKMSSRSIINSDSQFLHNYSFTKKQTILQNCKTAYAVFVSTSFNIFKTFFSLSHEPHAPASSETPNQYIVLTRHKGQAIEHSLNVQRVQIVRSSA